MNDTNVTRDGDCLVIRLPINPRPPLSATGKTKVVATTHGNQATAVLIDGKPLIVGVNAYIKP